VARRIRAAGRPTARGAWPGGQNYIEVSDGQECVKLVFAPPVGARSCNVHIRRSDGPNTRFALLFRDYLRSDVRARRAWGAFKQRLPVNVTDLLDYGQIKAPATEVLMAAAERWATESGWQIPTLFIEDQIGAHHQCAAPPKV
jgi:hypothetical protein